MLSRMVERFLGKELVCLSDQPNHVKSYKLVRRYQGWWSKLELFSPENRFLRPCLYFDLDTFILDDCKDLLIETNDLWLIRDFYNKDRSNSGMMIIPENTESIWENHFNWKRNDADGDFLNTQPHKILQDRFEGITSYKVHNQMSRIVCFHGKPKPPDTNDWAKEIWNHWTSPQS